MRHVVFLFFVLGLLIRPAFSSGVSLPAKITGQDGMEMMLVPAGGFIMGSSEEDLKDKSPEHEVYVDAFYMDKYEVTNELLSRFLNSQNLDDYVDDIRWDRLVIRSDLETPERFNWWPTEILYEEGTYHAVEGSESFPVISVSWHMAESYCRWAGERLPTEAEWEKAARGGLSKKIYPWGNEIPTGGIVFEKRWRDNAFPAPTGPVGNYHPNGYGIFDMAGNVWEWCSDWYDVNYYKNSPGKNPVGPVNGSEKVMRGGSWYNPASTLRVAVRNSAPPHSVNDGMGFRCVIDANKSK